MRIYITRLAALITLAFFLAPAYSAPVVITGINNLAIGSNNFNVVFHASASGLTFNEVFDADGDGNFTEADGSLVDHAPFFLGNAAGALEAANKVAQALTDSQATTLVGGIFRDIILVPYSAGDTPDVYYDVNGSLSSEGIAATTTTDFARNATHAWVSFELIPENNGTVSMPMPLLLVLLGFGVLLGRDKRRQTA